MQRYFTIFVILAIALCGMTVSAFAGIYGPEGLNMPGTYNSFTNPPTLNAFGGIEVVGGTLLIDNTLATSRYRTLIHVASAGDITTGSYDFKFSSGPTGSPWANSWGDGGTISANTVTHLNIGGGTANNTFTFNDNTYYSVSWIDSGYAGTSFVMMATSAVPVTIPTVAQVPAAAHVGTGAVTVKVTASAAPAPEEIVYVRYSTDGWVTSNLALVSFVGANGTASIPGQVAGTTVSYYVFSTTVGSPSSNYDVVTLNANTNSNANYSYTTEAHLFVATNSAQLGSVVWNPAGTPGGSDTAIIPDGVLDTINVNDSLASLIIGNGSSGSLRFDGVASRRFTVGNLLINSGGMFVGRYQGSAGYDSLNIWGDVTNNGTFDMYPGLVSGIPAGQYANTAVTVATFRKVGNQNLQTTGTPLLTRFGKVNFNKSSYNNKLIVSIDVQIGQGVHAPISGTPAGMVPSSLFLSGTTNVNQRGGWDQVAGTFYCWTTTISPSANAKFNFYGTSNVYDSTGAFFIGCPDTINTSGTFTFNEGNKTFGFEDTCIILSGTFNVYGQLEVAQFGTPAVLVNIQGGTWNIYAQGGLFETMDVGGNASSSAGGHLVYLGANGTGASKVAVNISGGTITLVNPIQTATTQREFVIGSIGTFTNTGGTINIGDGVDLHTGNKGFQIVDSSNKIIVPEPAHVLKNLVIQGGTGGGATNGRRVVLCNNLTVSNTFTIASGAALFDSTFTMTVNNNVTNSGTHTSGSGGEMKLTGSTGARTLSGGGSYGNLELSDANNASLSGNASVTGTLTLTTGTFSIGANTLTLQNAIGGTSTNLAGGATSSLVFNGPAASLNIPSSVTALNNFTLNNASGSTLQGQLAINGALTISNGALTTGTADTVTLGSTATLSEAGNGNIVLGNIQTTRTVSANTPATLKGKTPKSTLADQNFGGIGFEIDPAGGTSPGLTKVARVTGLAQGPSPLSIKRFYNVNAQTNTGLNSTVVLHYDNNTTELNSNWDGGLSLWKSTDNGGTWASQGGTVDTVAKTLTKTGVTSLSRWTASQVSLLPNTNQNSVVASGSLAIPGTISSIVNVQANEVSVFSFKVYDGGLSASDTDGVGTIITQLTVQQGSANTATDWTQYILGANLFTGATNLGAAVVASNTLTWSGTPLDSVSNNTNKEYTVKVYLKTSLPVGADGKVIEFKINQNADVNVSPYGSFMAPGGSDVVGTSGTAVSVVAAKLNFVGSIGFQNSGSPFGTTVTATDTNGNISAEFTSKVAASLASGSGVLSGTDSVAAVAGTVTFNNLIVTGHGSVSLNATSGLLIGATSNSFTVDSSALFYVTAGGPNDTLYWDSPSTWTFVSGYSHLGVPHSADHVIMDNTHQTGSYVVKVGVTSGGGQVSDTAATIKIGYPLNVNTITLLIPKQHTQYFPGAFYWGDGVAGNYDMDINAGGVFNNSSGVVGHNAFNYPAVSSNDSLRIRTGGKYVHASSSYQSGIFNMTRAMDGDYGTVEFDVPSTFSDLNAAGYWFPNLVFSNTQGAPTYYCYSGGVGPWHIKGNLTINPGVKDSLGVDPTLPTMISGNIINNGTTQFVAGAVAFAGSGPQTISGNTVTVSSGGIVTLASNVVTLQTDLKATGGTFQTGGNYTYVGDDGSNVTAGATGTFSTGIDTMFLSGTASLSEGNNPIQGVVSATTATLHNIATLEGPGNIGFDLNAAGNAPGSTTINRKTGTALVGFGGDQSIKRYYDVTATTNVGLNAGVVFSYTPADLNGILEANLLVNDSLSGTVWSGKAGTINTGTHQVTLSSSSNTINGRWTATANSAPLFQPYTVTVRKYQDNDGNIFTTGDETARKWRLSLYQDSISAGTLVNTANLNTGVLAVPYLPAGTYIATEADSTTSGWVTVGKVHHGVRQLSSSRYDTLTLSGGFSDSTDFINEHVSSITLLKFTTTDGNPADAVAEKWGLSLYQGSVSGGNLIASADTSMLVDFNVNPGTYIAVESDSGASWVRLNGNHTRFDTLTVLASTAVIDSFINFQPNSIVVHKLEDIDGNFATTADQVAKAWHLEIHKDSLGGALYYSSDSGAIVLNSVGNGTYVIVEADSTGWLNLGYTLNGTPTASNVTSLTVTLAAGQHAVINFVNAPPIYGRLFRTFDQDSLANDMDNKGKVGVPVKIKAVADKFAFTITPTDSSSTLTLNFSMLSTGTVMQGPDSVGSWTGSKVAGPFARKHNNLSAWTVVGQGTTGKPVVTKYTWATKKATKGTVATYTYNIPLLPEPNRVNGLQTAYTDAFATSGLLIGKDYSSNADSAKIYGWLLTKKYTDVLKTLYTKGATQDGKANHGFDIFLNNSKPLEKKQTSLPPAKYNNILLADLIALKVNIAMSDYGVTPPGFGDLIYNAGIPDSVVNGKTLREISAYGDSVIMGWFVDSTYLKGTKTVHVPVHHFASSSIFLQLDTAVHMINGAFEGPVDTASFATSLVFKGTRKLEGITFLSANPNANAPRVIPAPIGAGQNIPLAYKLEQNYPNPFNPTTTIQFSLMNPSIVTLKIYNILGQEVATLLNNAQLNDGVQSLSWNANNFASGVYFYRLSVEGTSTDDNGNAVGTGKTSFQQVKKMLLVK